MSGHTYNSATLVRAREDHKFPAESIVAFCLVTNDYSLLEVLVEQAGFKMIGPEEQVLLRIGRAFKAKSEAEKILSEVVA